MYRLMIVDDEMWVLESLNRIIDWAEYGMHIEEMFTDGKRALEAIQERQPDLVISDINMPYLSGLDLLKKINSEKLKTKVIFISGYSRFEYAQTAVNLGAAGYLLKPIQRQELCKLLLTFAETAPQSDSTPSHHAVEQLSEATERISADQDASAAKIGRIKAYIDQHYTENINLDSISRKFHINPSYLSSSFKEEVGVSFINYLTDQRMERAQQLLREGEKVNLVAHLVGYNDAKYFSVIFKRKVGISPSAYRLRYGN